MKPSLRIARRTLLGVTLLLAFFAMGVWIRSYFASHHLAYNSADSSTGQCRQYLLRADRGVVRLDYVARTFDTPEGVEMFVHGLSIFDKQELGLSRSTHPPVRYAPDDRSMLAKMGFGWYSLECETKRITRFRPTTRPVGRMTIRGAGGWLPLWFLTFLLALPAFRKLEILYRRRRRRDAGGCPVCGYDMRATPERCPECGRAASRMDTRAGRRQADPPLERTGR